SDAGGGVVRGSEVRGSRCERRSKKCRRGVFLILPSHLEPRTSSFIRFPVMPSPEPNKIIYSMVGVSKFHGKKQVLKDIYLSYFYGAKIGVIGLNGSGKSSLLRILAGDDKDHLGETVLSAGHTVGFLQQEPRLDDDKTVRENVEQGVQPIIDLLKEFD